MYLWYLIENVLNIRYIITLYRFIIYNIQIIHKINSYNMIYECRVHVCRWQFLCWQWMYSSSLNHVGFLIWNIFQTVQVWNNWICSNQGLLWSHSPTWQVIRRYLWQTIEALPQGGACLVVRLQVLGFCFLAWNSVKAVMPSCFLGRLQTVQGTRAAFSAELEVACWQIEDLYKIGQGSAVLSVRLTANCIEEELRTAAVALLAAEVRMQQWIWNTAIFVWSSFLNNPRCVFFH